MKKEKALRAACFLIYLFAVLWITVLIRPVIYQPAETELFWSYKRWIAGDTAIGREVAANIAMFIPLGFLLSGLLKERRKLLTVLAAAAVFTTAIETLQLVFMLGLFEIDDIISNISGALIGWGLYIILEKITDKKHFLICTRVISVTAAAACAALLVFVPRSDMTDNSSLTYCFQLDEVSVRDNGVTLDGFAIRYEQENRLPEVYLRSLSTGKITKLTTEAVERPDVNGYFLCDYDYTNSGFTAKTVEFDNGEEYEVMLRWPWRVKIPTGVYLTGEKVHYQPDNSFIPPTGGKDLEEIVGQGILRVYRPDYHCWVYQKGPELYWIVDDQFAFEEDGTTYIQYQLWTTQTENLPEERLAHNNLWDNIGGLFEEYELTGDFGTHRVMRRDLPSEYSITSIETGYYKNGGWIWRSYFRPIYLLKK